jgi:hypothetical protein
VDRAIDWLPPLILLEDFGGDWDRYMNELYSCFQQDYVFRLLPFFKGVRIGLKRHPIIDNKEATFWHLISSGKVEADRIPDIRRCERICWSRAVIELC